MTDVSFLPSRIVSPAWFSYETPRSCSRYSRSLVRRSIVCPPTVNVALLMSLVATESTYEKPFDGGGVNPRIHPACTSVSGAVKVPPVKLYAGYPLAVTKSGLRTSNPQNDALASF